MQPVEWLQGKYSWWQTMLHTLAIPPPHSSPFSSEQHRLPNELGSAGWYICNLFWAWQTIQIGFLIYPDSFMQSKCNGVSPWKHFWHTGTFITGLRNTFIFSRLLKLASKFGISETNDFGIWILTNFWLLLSLWEHAQLGSVNTKTHKSWHLPLTMLVTLV